MEDYDGSKYKVVHCDGARESLDEALSRVPNKKTQKAKMWRLIQRLGDGVRMPHDSFPTEGELPDKSNFKAIKKLPLRAYLWLSKKYKNTYFISHYIYKDKQKLSDTDTQKVRSSWRKKEE
jgi:hypothetical protein